ncbi:MAG TPA: MarR family transcriptional regulator [Burkholderiaceae bacterium]|jgi:DNA-binding MarR family transcriptional regulator
MSGPSGDPDVARAWAAAGELRVLLGRFRRRLRAEGTVGSFSASQREVLSRLDREGPATVTALARGEGMRPQSMGAIVAALEAAGLVSGAPDPNDGRQTILTLTPACRQLIRSSRAAREDWLFRAIRSELSAKEQKELATGVALLKRLVDA